MKRECGSCTLCCKLLPVPPLGKGAGERCRHQRATGCRVHNTPSMPIACRVWSCAWLVNNLNGAPVTVSRPDRTHYVIDCMPDYITVSNEGSEPQRITVMQIWVDPDYRDAHRDPALRAWLDGLAVQGIAALVRWSGDDAIVLIGPSMPGNSTGKWIEKGGAHEPAHDDRETAALISVELYQ